MANTISSGIRFLPRSQTEALCPPSGVEPDKPTPWDEKIHALRKALQVNNFQEQSSFNDISEIPDELLEDYVRASELPLKRIREGFTIEDLKEVLQMLEQVRDSYIANLHGSSI